jgi:hypothetical protein
MAAVGGLGCGLALLVRVGGPELEKEVSDRIFLFFNFNYNYTVLFFVYFLSIICRFFVFSLTVFFEPLCFCRLTLSVSFHAPRRDRDNRSAVVDRRERRLDHRHVILLEFEQGGREVIGGLADALSELLTGAGHGAVLAVLPHHGDEVDPDTLGRGRALA